MHRVAITGSEGLIGRHLRTALAEHSIEVVRIDQALPANTAGCVDLSGSGATAALHKLFENCDGVVHLGAVSRVVWGEHDPVRCWRTNVEGTSAVLRASAMCATRPWVLFASSREVYGNADRLPVIEDAPRQPLNVYARSKVAAEDLVLAARMELRTSVVRLSSVYGDVLDHADRVVPAFARAAAESGMLRVEGATHLLDLTYAPNVADGVIRLMQLLDGGDSKLPPVHLVSGVGTTLTALAQLACAVGNSTARLIDAPPRDYDVSHFVGDPSLARRLLGWEATTPLSDGMRRLVQEYAALGAARPSSAPERGRP